MRGLRIVLAAAAVSLVLVQGVRGGMLGLVLLAVNELIMLRVRLAGSQPVHLRPRWLRVPGRKQAARFPTFDPLISELLWAARSGRDFDVTLRRRFVRIVDAKLIGYDQDLAQLAADPDRATALLGSRLWTLVNPNRPMSGERARGGVSTREIARLLDDVDAIGTRDRQAGPDRKSNLDRKGRH